MVRDSTTGTAQGGIISPLLANVALTVLDEHFCANWDAHTTAYRAKRTANVAVPPSGSSICMEKLQSRPSQDDPRTADVFAQLHVANHSPGLIILPRVYTWIASCGEAGQEFALEDLPPDSAEVIEVPVVDPRVKLRSVHVVQRQTRQM
jgi:hypothetical protein